MRSLLGVTLAAVLAAGVAPGAQARPEDGIVMTADGGRQRGSLRYATTTGGDGRTCWIRHTDGRPGQPPAVAHDGSPLRWRLSDKRKPVAVSIRLTRVALDALPAPAAPETLKPVLTPVKSRNRVVAWTVTSPDVGYGDLDVSLTVAWKSRCGRDETQQRFHARSLPSPAA